jgi:hypothetical protein
MPFVFMDELFKEGGMGETWFPYGAIRISKDDSV